MIPPYQQAPKCSSILGVEDDSFMVEESLKMLAKCFIKTDQNNMLILHLCLNNLLYYE